MIDSDDRARIIQSPSLFMLYNLWAVIFVGENVP
jgi:type II secretory pathway component GspD/PulD (secretin)